MIDFHTPVGRLVQGSVIPQHQKHVETNQPMFENGQPVMGTFFALAFPKVLPNGQANTEFAQFHATMQQVAAAAWPALFPQGAAGPCTHPRFSWKYQDGDGTDQSGRSVADKAGFAGHHIVKFYTAYAVRCFNEGKFAAHEEIQDAGDVIKRGYWCRVFGEMKSNNASGTQVPGISIYPKLLSFVARGDEIASGPDAEAAFGNAAVGWRPPASASPIPQPGVPPVAMPAVGVPQVTMPAVGVPPVAMPAVGVPQVAMPQPPVATAPSYQIAPGLAAQGITIEGLVGQGWTMDALVQHGHAVKL